jgi:hypothetical protein
MIKRKFKFAYICCDMTFKKKKIKDDYQTYRPKNPGREEAEKIPCKHFSKPVIRKSKCHLFADSKQKTQTLSLQCRKVQKEIHDQL